MNRNTMFVVWLVLLVLPAISLSETSSPASKTSVDPEYAVGAWIWDSHTYDRQECRFWKLIEIPKGAAVKSATLRITADNSYSVFLDGQILGQGADWRVLIEYDMRLLLEPGSHVLAVQASNDFDVAGLLLGLRIEFTDDRVMEIGSDSSWKLAPTNKAGWKTAGSNEAKRWPSATVLKPFDRASRPSVYKAPVSQPALVPFWKRGWFQFTLALSSVVTTIICVWLLSRLVLNSQKEKIVRRERSRIAADLHDDLGGGLTQLVLLGEVSRRGVSPGSPASGSLDRICEESRSLLREMNETVWLINSHRDTIRDFASYAGRYAEDFFKGSSVQCRFDIEADLPELPCDIGLRRNLFLALKEALNNVLKHSGASEILLGIHRSKNEIVVLIADNGKGFDPASTDPEGNGLENMKQRAVDAGGCCRISSVPGAGCSVEFLVPLTSSRYKWPRWLRIKRGPSRSHHPVQPRISR